MARTAGSRRVGGSSPDRDGRRWPVLAVLCVSLLVVSLDTTILNVALPAIVRSLGASSSELQWIVDTYSIVFAGLLLVMGSLGDRLGRKWVFLAGLLVFACGSTLSAFSGTPDRLIAARGFMGIGAAAIMPCTLSILTNVFLDPAERARAIGIWSGTTGLGVAFGPVAGGWLLSRYWWGSVFLVNVPIALLGVVATLSLVPDSKNPQSLRPDSLGGLLSIAGMASLLWGIIEAPTMSWGSPWVIGSLVAAVTVLAVFAWWEMRCDHPMLRLHLFEERRFSVAMTALASVIFALMGGLFMLTQYLQFSLGYSPFAAGLGILSVTTVHGTYLDALPGFLVIGFGVGLALAPCTDSIMGAVSTEEAGAGSATNGAALQTGGALGVAVLGSLLASRYQALVAVPLHAAHAPAQAVAAATGSLGGALEVASRVGGEMGAALASLARVAFVNGMDLALVVAAVVVSAAAVVVLVLLPSRPAAHAPDGGPEGELTVGPGGPEREQPHRGRGRSAGPTIGFEAAAPQLSALNHRRVGPVGESASAMLAVARGFGS